MDQVVRAAAIPYQHVPGDDVAAAMQPAPELCVVIPTFSERDNVPVVVDRLRQVLAGVAWEIIFVDDDSPDGTAAAVLAIAEQDRRVRCIRRIGRRGLSGACLEGLLASQARYVAVMDADLQHDETRLVSMLDHIRKGNIDLVVASRYAVAGSGNALSRGRAQISRWSTLLARAVLGQDLTDPLSGFFMVRRATVEALAPSLSSQGFKILLDIVVTAREGVRIVEVPAEFRKRLHGESKLDSRVALEFVGLMLAKLTNDAVSIRFVLFCLVGLSGVGIHMAVLNTMLKLAGLPFGPAQATATVLAIAWNFALNNQLTYRDQRLTGWRFLTGLLWFEVICAVGAISNIGVATWIYTNDSNWWIAGLGGALMGAVWNYAVSAVFVWRSR
jgi:dolichol-phosphate mannosyltransferase